MKAIETKYKGYRFRSRLEARWAVFFDALGLQWEYEPEGFDLGAAGWYLPDFYLPQLDSWIEIKPGNGNRDEVRQQLIGMMETGAAEHAKAWGFFGDPLSAYWLLPCFYDGSGQGKWHDHPGWYDEWPDAGVAFQHDKEGWIAFATFREGGRIPEDFADIGDDRLFDNYKEKIAARSARFEHGERG